MSRGPALRPTPSKPRQRIEFEAGPDRERRNPIYRWVMHLGLPLGISILIHVLVLLGASLYTFSVLATPTTEVGEYEAGLIERPDNRLKDAFRWNEQVTLETPEVVPITDWSLSDFTRVAPLDKNALDTSAEGAGLGGGGDLGEFGIGEGRFSLLGTGRGASQAGAGGFGSGLGGRGGRLGQAGIWNVRVQANKIVYVVDFSGSIIVAVDDLRRELKRSIGRLSPAQSFNVIVFYSEDERFKTESFAAQLQSATEQTRTAFFQWIDRKAPRGQTRPLSAVRRALALQPEAIFFFSDGLFEDSVVEEVTRANRSVQAKILCLVFDELLLQYSGPLPRETEGARRLRRIAEQNHGKAKIVTGSDLQR